MALGLRSMGRRRIAASCALPLLALLMTASPAGAVAWPPGPALHRSFAQPSEAPAEPVVREPIVEQTTGMVFQPVPAGCFAMGDPDDQQPIKVCLDGFFLGANEVTNSQFRRFRPDHDSGSFGGQTLNGDDQPVVNVSWQDAVSFTEWLSATAGERFRLPTEAEWEYACRSGTLPAAEGLGEVANLRAGADAKGTVTAPVGQHPANGWGFYDMLGNASEWVADNYVAGNDRYGAALDNPVVRVESPLRVRRGGSWDDTPVMGHSWARDYYLGELRVPQTGFRVVLERKP